ncbi:MAG: hypothetical protein U0573_02600 [Phycisphaerales bacterium]|nr:hypothetical protein [Planctomycetota bacterium]
MALSFLMGVSALAAPQPRPGPIETGGSFDDRSAPSTYQYDSPPYSGWNFGAGFTAEMIGVNAFDAVGGSDLLTSVSCVWKAVANGSTQRIFIWQDDGSNSMSSAKLIHEQSVVAANADTTTMNAYTLTKAVPVSGRFYVGFSSVTDGTTFVAAWHYVPSGALPNRALLAVAAPPYDATKPPNVYSFTPIDSIGFPGYFAVRASGSGGTFSYQGRLTSGGQPYTGNADLICTIYDSQSGGVKVGESVALAGVPVLAGVFSVQIPADPSWFVNAPDRYLDVQVRTPAGGGTYTSITPRQRIGQTPAAMVATVAQTAQSVPWAGVTGVPGILSAWQPATGGVAYNAGRVGIGTGAPSAALHVVGGPSYFNTIIESSFTDGTWFNLSNSSVNGRWWSLVVTGSTNFEGAGALLIRDNTVGIVRAIFTPSGNVGIGTITPGERLEVRGNVRFGDSGEYDAIGANAEKISVIRGSVNLNGTVRLGTGFTATRQALGVYRINWTATPGFSDAPSVVATAYLSPAPVVVWVSGSQINSDGSGFVDLRTAGLSGVLTDTAFSFTLTGPR